MLGTGSALSGVTEGCVVPLPPDIQKMNALSLIDMLIATVSEKALLQYSDAPMAELVNVQSKIDALQQELFRRCSW